MLYRWVSEGKVPPKTTYTAGQMVYRSDCRKVIKEQGLID